MVLLATFLGIWWQQSYQKDLEALRSKVEGEINRLVSDEFVYPTLRALLLHEGPVQPGALALPQARFERQTKEFRVERIRSNAKGQPERLELSIFSNSRPIANSHFFYENKRIALDQLPETVRDSMYRKFGINLQPVFYPSAPFQFNDRFSKIPENPMTVEIRHIANDQGNFPKASFVIQDYVPALLVGLLPEFLFGLVLFGATGFAFASAYRNMFEQEKQLQAKDVLVANVAHELKTPIATVGVALEALNMFGADGDPERRREYLAIGQSELKRLNTMADRAIDSLQDGDLSQRLSLGWCDLAGNINEAWRGLALRYNLPDDALTLSRYGDTMALVDQHYWHHLVYNLLDNACKYGGRPLIIDVNVSSHAGENVLTVSDNGPGIPPKERDSIFDRFYRVYRPGEGHAVKGHGLGLSFVRQIAKAHGGSVEVDNNSTGGARFTVRIPGSAGGQMM